MSQDKQTQEVKPFEWIPGDDGVFETYSNFVHANWTIQDVRIRFGQLTPARDEPPRWLVKENAAVTLSWYQLKFLRDLVNDLVDRYEKANGELVPPQMP